MSLITYTALWGVLALFVLVLGIYRMRLAGHTDELIHIDEAEAKVIPEQEVVARKLDRIDRWGKSLTVVVALAGLAIAGVWVYRVWQTSGTSAL